MTAFVYRSLHGDFPDRRPAEIEEKMPQQSEMLRRPVQLTHSEYHMPTRRLSGSIAVEHPAMDADHAECEHKVFVRASVDGGRTFTDYEAHRLFEGFEAPDGETHQDFFAFSIRLARSNSRSRVLLRQRSLDIARDKGAGPVTVRFMVVCDSDNGECTTDDNDGQLYSVVLQDL